MSILKIDVIEGTNVMDSSTFFTKKIHNLQLNFLKTEKYKTNIIVVNMARSLTKDSVTKTALLPYILKRGTKNHSSLKAIQDRLDTLYGALFHIDVFKRGEKQIVQFSLEVSNEKYLQSKEQLFFQAISLLGEIITNPLVEETNFKKEFVRIGKDMLANRINGILDDKIAYAEYQTIKNMCENEPYRLLEYGEIDQLEGITSKDLYDYYQEWLRTSAIDVFVIGNLNEEEVMEAIKSDFYFPNREVMNMQANIINVPVSSEKMVTEEQNVTQGKLDIGLRTYTSIQDDDYSHLLLYNGLLGGFAHSKLFVNVREKASLAYYAASKLDSHKGIMTIQSGIETNNFSKALEIIKEQLILLKNGDISDQELALTKSVYSSQLKVMLDKPRQFIDFSYHSVLSGKKRNLSELLHQLEQVRIEDVVKVANKVTIDTIYFLKGKQKEGK